MEAREAAMVVAMEVEETEGVQSATVAVEATGSSSPHTRSSS